MVFQGIRESSYLQGFLLLIYQALLQACTWSATQKRSKHVQGIVIFGSLARHTVSLENRRKLNVIVNGIATSPFMAGSSMFGR